MWVGIHLLCVLYLIEFNAMLFNQSATLSDIHSPLTNSSSGGCFIVSFLSLLLWLLFSRAWFVSFCSFDLHPSISYPASSFLGIVPVPKHAIYFGLLFPENRQPIWHPSYLSSHLVTTFLSLKVEWTKFFACFPFHRFFTVVWLWSLSLILQTTLCWKPAFVS